MPRSKQRLLRTFIVELFIPEGPEADNLASDLMPETDFLQEKIEQLLEDELSGRRPAKSWNGTLHCDYFVSEAPRE